MKTKLIAIPPGKHEVQVDLDLPSDLRFFLEQMQMLRRRSANYGFTYSWRYKVKRSRNGHWHATVWKEQWHWPAKPRPFTAPERIALQACLGSDRRRELLSLLRHFAGAKYTSLFFEEKSEKPKTHHLKLD